MNACVPMRSFDEEGSVPGRVNGAVEYTVPVVIRFFSYCYILQEFCLLLC